MTIAPPTYGSVYYVKIAEETLKSDIETGVKTIDGTAYEDVDHYTQTYRITFPRYKDFNTGTVGPIAMRCIEVVNEMEPLRKWIHPEQWWEHSNIVSITKDNWILEVKSVQRSELLPFVTVRLAQEFPDSVVTARRLGQEDTYNK